MQTPFGYQLTQLSNTHDAIANWLIANPGKGQMGACAKAFGITGAWLSTLVHQDAFQAMMKVKQGVVFEEVVIPLQSKILGVAHRSVERMGEILETTDDERLVKDIGKDMLTNLGFGANTQGPAVQITQTTNNLTVNADALASARARQSQHYGRTLESPSEPEQSARPASPPELPHYSEPELGAPSDIRAEHVNGEAEVQGNSAERGGV